MTKKHPEWSMHPCTSDSVSPYSSNIKINLHFIRRFDNGQMSACVRAYVFGTVLLDILHISIETQFTEPENQ